MNLGKLTLYILSIMPFYIGSLAFAEYRDPEVRTHINEQTTYFKDTLDDPEALMQEFKGSFEKAQQQVVGAEQALAGTNELIGASREEVMKSSDNLSSIKAIDLDSRGKEELIKEDIIDDLYVDYSKPLNKQHLKDAELLADAQEELFANLFGKLKELGVDCKTVKGDVIQEPEFYLQVKTTQHKDTVYNQTFCEQLRNKYNCRDSLTLKCKRKGIKWNPWQPKRKEYSGHWILANAFGWFKGEKFHKKKFGAHLNAGNPVVAMQARALIAQELQVDIEQISPHLVVHERGFGGGCDTPTLHDKLYMWPTYAIDYHFRDGEEICEEWDEDWEERCSLQ